MIAQAIAAKVPFSFVAADSVYGTGDIEAMLRKAGKGYVLGIASNHSSALGARRRLIDTAGNVAQSLPKAWRRLSAGDGPKGRGCMIGPISNWPTSRLETTTAR